MLKILPFNDWDKDIIVVDSKDGFVMKVDYDDVDHDKVKARIKKIVALCNEHKI